MKLKQGVDYFIAQDRTSPFKKKGAYQVFYGCKNCKGVPLRLIDVIRVYVKNGVKAPKNIKCPECLTNSLVPVY